VAPHKHIYQSCNFGSHLTLVLVHLVMIWPITSGRWCLYWNFKRFWCHLLLPWKSIKIDINSQLPYVAHCRTCLESSPAKSQMQTIGIAFKVDLVNTLVKLATSNNHRIVRSPHMVFNESYLDMATSCQWKLYWST